MAARCIRLRSARPSNRSIRLLDSSLIHANSPRLTHAAVMPVRLATELGGHLIAGFTTAPQDRTLTLWSGECYAAAIALCLHDPGALDGLIAAAQRDELTGCLTYEGTLRELDRELNRSARGGLALSVCFIDLDGFKRVDDEHGHLRGNEILALVGGILRDGVRGSDTVGRYGGDEFIAILPQTNEADARQLAHRLRSRLASTPIPSLQRSLTASIGVAQWSPGTPREDLLAAADGAQLRAKARCAASSPRATRDRRPRSASCRRSNAVGTVADPPPPGARVLLGELAIEPAATNAHVESTMRVCRSPRSRVGWDEPTPP